MMQLKKCSFGVKQQSHTNLLIVVLLFTVTDYTFGIFSNFSDEQMLFCINYIAVTWLRFPLASHAHVCQLNFLSEIEIS